MYCKLQAFDSLIWLMVENTEQFVTKLLPVRELGETGRGGATKRQEQRDDCKISSTATNNSKLSVCINTGRWAQARAHKGTLQTKPEKKLLHL